jgi:hypothetical protein
MSHLVSLPRQDKEAIAVTGAQIEQELPLLDAAVALLRDHLPASWSVEKQTTGADPAPGDLVITSPGSPASALILVETRAEVSSRDVQALRGGPWRRGQRLAGDQPTMLVARYLSPRVRELLAEEHISYVDLTGNVRITVDIPGIYIEAQGASQDPHSVKRRTSVGGARAGAVVRALVDAAPPYTGRAIAAAAGVNEGYVSRILETLLDEGLIERDRTGPVRKADWPALLRRRAQAVDLLRPRAAQRFVARQGTAALLEALRGRAVETPPPTVTGSFAAARLAPVAAPALLVVYSRTPSQLAAQLDVLPTDEGADTVLLRPDDQVVFARATRDGGMAWAAPSQVAIDCLSGSGRMPSEGEALIEWMERNESAWRAPSIDKLPEARSS